MKNLKLTEIMINNKIMKLCLEIRVHQKPTLLISKYVDVYLDHLPCSMLNIKSERFLKRFHKITISADIPEGILCADE